MLLGEREIIMKRKGKLIVIALSFVMILAIGILYIASSKDVNEIVDSITENYELRSKSVGRNELGPFIYINLQHREDIVEVENLLKKKLSKKDLEKYRIHVTAIPREK